MKGLKKHQLSDIQVEKATYHTETFDYVDVDKVGMDEEELRNLERWLHGQTVPVIAGVRRAVYVTDFDRWRRGKPVID